jgi:transposase
MDLLLIEESACYTRPPTLIDGQHDIVPQYIAGDRSARTSRCSQDIVPPVLVCSALLAFPAVPDRGGAMPKGEVERRREAVARVLSGEPAGKVVADLGRTDRWVRKWVSRYDPAEKTWATDESRAPRTIPTRTPDGTRRLILQARERLMADPWAQVGAVAIPWELDKLGFEHPPEVWTIDRILREAGVPKRRARTAYVPKGTPYPAGPILVRPNAVHQIDLVGPRHLEGAVPFTP